MPMKFAPPGRDRLAFSRRSPWTLKGSIAVSGFSTTGHRRTAARNGEIHSAAAEQKRMGREGTERVPLPALHKGKAISCLLEHLHPHDYLVAQCFLRQAGNQTELLTGNGSLPYFARFGAIP